MTATPESPNRLYFGDNLDILRRASHRRRSRGRQHSLV